MEFEISMIRNWLFALGSILTVQASVYLTSNYNFSAAEAKFSLKERFQDTTIFTIYCFQQVLSSPTNLAFTVDCDVVHDTPLTDLGGLGRGYGLPKEYQIIQTIERVVQGYLPTFYISWGLIAASAIIIFLDFIFICKYRPLSRPELEPGAPEIELKVMPQPEVTAMPLELSPFELPPIKVPASAPASVPPLASPLKITLTPPPSAGPIKKSLVLPPLATPIPLFEETKAPPPQAQVIDLSIKNSASEHPENLRRGKRLYVMVWINLFLFASVAITLVLSNSFYWTVASF